MIKDRDTSIGYHCPYCGLAILNNINTFLMNDNLIKLRCMCGHGEGSVQALKNNKYKITVPCILCPNSHSYTLSSAAFFQKDLFSFSCKFTAIDICFIGKGSKVYEALQKNEEKLIDMFSAFEEEYGGEDDIDTNVTDIYDDFINTNDFDPGVFESLAEFMAFNSEKNQQKEPGFILHKNTEFTENNVKDNIGISAQSADEIDLESYQIMTHILTALSALYANKKIFCRCGDFDAKLVLLGNSIHLECKNCQSCRNIQAANTTDAEYFNDIEDFYLDFE